MRLILWVDFLYSFTPPRCLFILVCSKIQPKNSLSNLTFSSQFPHPSHLLEVSQNFIKDAKGKKAITICWFICHWKKKVHFPHFLSIEFSFSLNQLMMVELEKSVAIWSPNLNKLSIKNTIEINKSKISKSKVNGRLPNNMHSLFHFPSSRMSHDSVSLDGRFPFG